MKMIKVSQEDVEQKYMYVKSNMQSCCHNCGDNSSACVHGVQTNNNNIVIVI